VGASSVVFLFGLILLGLFVYFFFHQTYSEEDILNRIRLDIAPAVVRLECFEKDQTDVARFGTGLFYIDGDTNTPKIETNAHVVLDDDGIYYGCFVYFPRPSDGTYYDSAYRTGTSTSFERSKSIVNGVTVEGIDYAILDLVPVTGTSSATYPFPPAKTNPYTAISDMCGKNSNDEATIKIGEKVYLLGYPGTGSDSLTMTEGLVSGFLGENNEWLKVSASSNHGNSGGIAIGATNGCNYGILTGATFEKGANLGFVLSGGFIRNFLAGTTGEYTYEVPVIEKGVDASKYLTQTQELLDFTLKYPEGWKVATSSPNQDDGHYYVDIFSPQEGAIDVLADGISVYVYPNYTKEKFDQKMVSVKEFVRGTDKKNNDGEDVMRKGILMHEIFFQDFTRKIYSIPLFGYYTDFMYKGTFYHIIGRYGSNKNSDSYRSILKAMINSIEFK
jgi:hypothetical protein